jgi:hypothetical protein
MCHYPTDPERKRQSGFVDTFCGRCDGLVQEQGEDKFDTFRDVEINREIDVLMKKRAVSKKNNWIVAQNLWNIRWKVNGLVEEDVRQTYLLADMYSSSL